MTVKHEGNLNYTGFREDLSHETYSITGGEAIITKLKNGETVININQGSAIVLTLRCSGDVDVFDWWGWGNG